MFQSKADIVERAEEIQTFNIGAINTIASVRNDSEVLKGVAESANEDITNIEVPVELTQNTMLSAMGEQQQNITMGNLSLPGGIAGSKLAENIVDQSKNISLDEVRTKVVITSTFMTEVDIIKSCKDSTMPPGKCNNLSETLS